MKTILIITQYYLPGYKAGGPIRSLSNLISVIKDQFRIKIITADRDLGDIEPYHNINKNKWNKKNGSEIYYFENKKINFFKWYKLLKDTEYDLIYLNSFFATETIRTLFLNWLHLLPTKKILLTPRGEFNPGALFLKSYKKSIYLLFTKLIKFYDGIYWHATNEKEKMYLVDTLSNSILIKNIFLASNIPAIINDYSRQERILKEKENLRVVFLSRISRMKNLDYALSLFHGFDSRIIFDRYGPLEDKVYWHECEKIITKLSKNIYVSYKGTVRNENVCEILAKYHILLLPTRGENFGHVIFEAFSAGRPVIISDQTPWRNLKERHIGFDLQLNNKEKFIDAINYFYQMDDKEYQLWSNSSEEFSQKYINNKELITNIISIFNNIMNE